MANFPRFKFLSHSKTAIKLAIEHGWLPGARYTNLRDVKSFNRLGFLDIDWKNYDFSTHLKATESTRPIMTVARDIENINDLDTTISQAFRLKKYADFVVIVPKDKRCIPLLDSHIPKDYILGYSVPTKYGNSIIPPECFRRPVHLLGGRPDIQRRLADLMPVFSFDCNRFTLDASFGDYFDGERFRPHPKGGYQRCLVESIKNINLIWKSYNIDCKFDYKSLKED